MGIRSEDEDFLAFRDAGDPEALARVFDAVAPRLLLVAAHLARDAGQAEDLVQTTFLHAMRDAARYDGARPVAGWLAGILRHRALDARRRGALRRAEPLEEHADVAGAPRDPAELAADRELFERVSAAVDALPDPYREVLVLRLAHGLGPTEIAHALGRRPGTVRMQLERGRERLQRAMPQLSSVLGAALGEPLRGLAAVREAVVAEAEALAPVATAASAGATAAAATVGQGVLGGLIAMKTVGIVVLVGLGALWFALQGRSAAPASAPRDAAVAPEVARMEPLEAVPEVDAAAPERTAVAAPARSAEEREPAASEVATGPGSLTVRVRYAADDAPASDVGVYVRPPREAFGEERRTGDDGAVVFEAPPAGLLEIHLDRTMDPVRTRHVAGRDETLELRIPRGLRITGRVVDLDGEGVSGARVYRFNDRHHDLLQEVARADAEGRFELRDAEIGERFVARAPGYQPSDLDWVGGDAHLELVLGARGHRVTGHVLGADGEPVPRAWVAVGVDEDARESLEGSERSPGDGTLRKPLDREAFFLRADEDGRFESDEVPAGNALFLARSPAGSARDGGEGAIGAETLWVGGDAEQAVTIRLEAAATLAGVVRDETGVPVAGFAVEAEWEGTRALGQMEDDLGPWMSDRRAITADDGSYRLAGLLEGDYDLRVEGPRGERLVRDEREVARGAALEWNPVVPLGVPLAVRLLDPAGAPLAGWGVAVSREDAALAGDPRALQRTGDDGRASVPHLEPDAPLAVGLYPPLPGGRLYAVADLPAAVRTGIVAGSGPCTIRLSTEELPSASLVGRWTGPGGAPVAGAEVRLERAGWSNVARAVTAEDGGFAFDALSAGELLLTTGIGPYPRGVSLASAELRPGERHDLGEVTLEGRSRLVVALTAAGAPDENQALLSLVPLDPEAPAPRARFERGGAPGVWVSTALPPGEYWLRVKGEPFAAVVREVVVGTAPETRVSVERVRGEAVAVDVLLPPVTEDLIHLRVRVRDEDGVLVLDDHVYTVGGRDAEAPETTLSLRLLPGRYRVEVALAARPDGAVAAGLEVPRDADAAGEPVRLSLR